MKRILIKWGLLAVFLLVAVYFAAGLILPFCHLKTVGEDYRLLVKEREYYGEEGKGTDRACIIETAQEALDIRIQLLDGAQESIVLTTFDIRDGESTRDIAAVLLQAADRGVEVEILVDGMSGFLRMKKPVFKLLGSHENIEIRLYNEPNPLKPWTINGRMHDKYIMVDGTYLLMGGRNTFDYFLGTYTDKNLSLDREVFFVSDLEAEDSAIAQMNAYYEMVWNQKECKPLYDKEKYGQGAEEKKLRQELENRYETMKLTDDFAGISFKERTVPVNKATLLYNPTHIAGKEPWLFYELAALMKQAEERVYIHTPYAVMNSYMYGEMTSLAGQVSEFTMQLNAIANGDNVCASSDYIQNKEKLIGCGMTLYEYDGGDSSHGKSVLIDDRISVIGSFNFDMRSAYIDTELMFVIDSRELNQSLYDNLMVLQEDSMKVLSADEYELKEGQEVSQISKGRKMFLKVFGWVMQPFRFFL